MWDKNAGILF